jgi:O-antigen/teichoic acid export membrane protein
LATTATLLGAAGVSAAARKYMADAAGQKQPGVFRALLRGGLVAQTAILALLTLVGLVWANVALPSDERVFASLAMIAILPGGVMYMATAINNAVQELRPNVVASIAAGFVHTVGMILTVVMGWGLVGLAVASLASRTCDCVVRWLLTVARLPGYLRAMGEAAPPAGDRPRLPPGMSRQFAVFVGESSILTTLSLVVWNRSEMLFLKHYSAIEQVAYFSVAFGLSLLPGQLVGPFSRAAIVGVYAEHGRAEQAGLHVARVYWRYLVLMVMPASLGLAVLSGPLLSLLYGARYADAAPVLFVAGALSMFGPLASPATSLVTAAGGQRRLVTVGLVAAMATLALDYVLVRAYAAIGGAIANGLGQAISTLTIVLVARRYAFRVASPFFLRVTGAALGMAVVVAAAAYFLPAIVGVVLGPVLGAVAYCGFLRALRVVNGEDVERLLKAESLLPRRLRAPYRRLLGAVAVPGDARAED